MKNLKFMRLICRNEECGLVFLLHSYAYISNITSKTFYCPICGEYKAEPFLPEDEDGNFSEERTEDNY